MPRISLIVPCYNEQATIRLLLDAICSQTVPHADLEVIIADGRSTDRTRAVVGEFQREHPDLSVRLVDNPLRHIPSALNRALEAAQGQYIIRLDAHSIPAADYVERCVAGLESGQAENIGGVWEIRPRGNGLMQRAIAVAAAHPFGVGDALYRYATEPAYVDTVPFGAFRRETFDRLGMFDETLLTNEDYEMNARIRQSGGRVYLDPRIHSVYFSRASLGELARQYARYGYWKWRMLRRYPGTLRWRQLLPPVFVLSLIGLLILSIFWGAARWLLLVELVLYFLALAAGSFKAARRQRDPRLLAAVPLAIATMHLTWGSALLWSALTTRGSAASKA